MKSIAKKYHLPVTTSDEDIIRIYNFDISNSRCKKLSGVKFDHRTTFHDHVSDLCKSARPKSHALARVI